MIPSIFFCAACASTWSQSAAPAGDAAPSLTIYNRDFAVVRELLPLDLKAGVNAVEFAGMSAQLEPDSVILRDPSGQRRLQILEQNYRNDPLTQERLLELYKGQTIEFTRERADGSLERTRGRIVRSGYVAPRFDAYGNLQWQQPPQPLIEVEGTLRFQLPGVPLFPALADDTRLEPTLGWQLETDKPGSFPAELAYVTGGMSWSADYNIVSPEQGDLLDIVGWVTIVNKTGKSFREARIKLMAGDVNKLTPNERDQRLGLANKSAAMAEMSGAPVTERSFNEFHLYTLARPSTLHDAETKQVEFVRAVGVPSQRIYVYDGAATDYEQWHGWSAENLRAEPSYGTQTNKKVWVMREFKNSAAQGLGMPLPKGRLRFYRQDSDRRLEFTGENTIDHTPKDELLRVYTGNSFDLVGERLRTDFKIDSGARWIDESFEITLRNHKQEPVEFRVVEHLYRWINWEIKDCEEAWTKRDSQTIEFKIDVPADGERKIRYRVHYWW